MASEGFDSVWSRPYVQAIVDRCRAAYCLATTTNQPELCLPSAAITKVNVTTFVAWLVDRELMLPKGPSEYWASSMYLGEWLQ